ncbi:MAG TPA: hypothetical protein VEI83_00165 [Acidimicrobiales bacterium]|nr:hypothetical protein [Acidimicrobiales bacterium]
MPPTIRRLALALTIVVGAMAASGWSAPVAADPASGLAGSGSSDVIGTMLPPGWELCILQGVGASASAANITDLDEWQLAEGGSTDNTAAYNPYNTRRMTDVDNNALSAVVSSNGFPAFADWPAGCAATVATLLQSNMTPIVDALRAGNVSPPAAFLAAVDKSQWCAPSSDGTPCYASEILGGTGILAAALVTSSSALTVYSSVNADVTAYVQAADASAADQEEVATTTQDLLSVQTAVVSAQGDLDGATRALRALALDEYSSNGSMSADSALRLFEPSDPRSLLVQQYDGIAATNLIARYRHAAASLEEQIAQRSTASEDVARATSAVISDRMAEDQAFTRLQQDTAALEAAGACSLTTNDANTSATGSPAPNATTTGALDTNGSATSGGVTPVPGSPPAQPGSATSASEPTGPSSPGAAANGSAANGSGAGGQGAPGSSGAAAGGAAGTPAVGGSLDSAALGALQGCLSALAPPSSQGSATGTSTSSPGGQGPATTPPTPQGPGLALPVGPGLPSAAPFGKQ